MYIFQYLRHVLKLLPFQGATVPTRDTQGAASLALGWVLHWAFSPHFRCKNTPSLPLKRILFPDSVGCERCHSIDNQ